VTQDLTVDGARWARQVEFVLADRAAAFARVRNLREVLLPSLSWEQSASALLREATGG
jgi:hypothetical protein